MNSIDVKKECLDPIIISYILTTCHYLCLRNNYNTSARCRPQKDFLPLPDPYQEVNIVFTYNIMSHLLVLFPFFFSKYFSTFILPSMMPLIPVNTTQNKLLNINLCFSNLKDRKFCYLAFYFQIAFLHIMLNFLSFPLCLNFIKYNKGHVTQSEIHNMIFFTVHKFRFSNQRNKRISYPAVVAELLRRLLHSSIYGSC